MRVIVDGKLPNGLWAQRTSSSPSSARSGLPAATGHVIEYAGEAIRALSMDRPDDDLQHVDRGRPPAPG